MIKYYHQDEHEKVEERGCLLMLIMFIVLISMLVFVIFACCKEFYARGDDFFRSRMDGSNAGTNAVTISQLEMTHEEGET